MLLKGTTIQGYLPEVGNRREHSYMGLLFGYLKAKHSSELVASFCDDTKLLLVLSVSGDSFVSEISTH